LPLSSPTLPPHPYLLRPPLTPPKPCSFTLVLSFCSFRQALLSRVWRPQKTSFLRSTRDRCPPDPLTPQLCISCLNPLSFVARPSRLDCTLYRSFLGGQGLRP
jgi:hypothetical protein